jgi:hypothetical protein
MEHFELMVSPARIQIREFPLSQECHGFVIVTALSFKEQSKMSPVCRSIERRPAVDQTATARPAQRQPGPHTLKSNRRNVAGRAIDRPAGGRYPGPPLGYPGRVAAGPTLCPFAHNPRRAARCRPFMPERERRPALL